MENEGQLPIFHENRALSPFSPFSVERNEEVQGRKMSSVRREEATNPPMGRPLYSQFFTPVVKRVITDLE